MSRGGGGRNDLSQQAVFAYDREKTREAVEIPITRRNAAEHGVTRSWATGGTTSCPLCDRLLRGVLRSQRVAELQQ